MKIIIKEHENQNQTGGYTVFKKRHSSKRIYIKFWGVYGNETRLVRECEEI